MKKLPIFLMFITLLHNLGAMESSFENEKHGVSITQDSAHQFAKCWLNEHGGEKGDKALAYLLALGYNFAAEIAKKLPGLDSERDSSLIYGILLRQNDVVENRLLRWHAGLEKTDYDQLNRAFLFTIGLKQNNLLNSIITYMFIFITEESRRTGLGVAAAVNNVEAFSWLYGMMPKTTVHDESEFSGALESALYWAAISRNLPICHHILQAKISGDALKIILKKIEDYTLDSESSRSLTLKDKELLFRIKQKLIGAITAFDISILKPNFETQRHKQLVRPAQQMRVKSNNGLFGSEN